MLSHFHCRRACIASLLVLTLLERNAVKPDHLFQPVKNRSPHSQPGKRGKLEPTTFVKSPHGLQEPDLPVRHEIIKIHMIWDTAMQFPSHRTHQPLVQKKLSICRC